MSSTNLRCFFCSKVLSLKGPVSLREECPHCDGDLHICKNCRFYDEGYYNECREERAERVSEREKRNFCDYFQTNETNEANKTNETNEANDVNDVNETTGGGSALRGAFSYKEKLLSEAEKLFKKKK